MHQMAKAQGLFVIALACSLFGPASLADPMHKYGNAGAYRHEHSGWLFPKQVGDFARVGEPYLIDGSSSDIGGEYAQGMNEARVSASVEVYGSDSVASDAKLENAKASAARKAGTAAHLQEEGSFQLGARDDLSAVKVTYVPEAKSQRSQTRLYFITTERWVVKVLASIGTADDDAGKTLDAFVRDLPWNTLGVDPGDLLHPGS
jgi:hypothetical protein